MKTDSEKIENINLNQLLVKLRKEDSNYAKISKAFTVVYWILIPLYILLTILKYSELSSLEVIISGSCWIFAFIIFIFSFKKYYKDFKFVDYSLPILEMLKKAAWRYRPFQLRSVWIIIALIFMSIGLTLDLHNFGISLLIIQALYWGLIIFAFIVGLFRWYFKYKPIRDEALQLIKEIEGE
jgi:hypothetical protein